MNAEQAREEAMDQLQYDLADVIHIGTTHPVSVVCHGNNDDCGGGPDPFDHDLAARAMEYVRDAFKDLL